MKAEPRKKAVKKSTNVLLWALPFGIALLTFICYHYSLGNQFTNWDDERFISENIFIKSFSSANLKMMLFHDVTGDYYNPLTILSYAVNYHFSGLAPQSYYLTNIIIHILNSCLMFFMVLMLLKAMEKNGYGLASGEIKWKEWLALFCTLAYAVHPMHVESVSWAAERKDVLYAFFYFFGIITYLRFIEAETKKYLWFFYVFIFFMLSLLSKPMAIVFPFSLLAIDILLKRDKTTSKRNIILEKIPFLVIAIASAGATYIAQKSAGAVQAHQLYSFFQRFLFASYGFYMYMLKAIIPIAQTSFYPYPENSAGPDGSLSILFYISPLIALLVIAVPLYFSYRSGENNFRIVLFGLIFYFFNMIIVSQIISSGPNMMAERYSYICYFGIFFPLTIFVYKIVQRNDLVRNLITVGLSLYMLLFSVLCYGRTLVWHDSGTLWTDVIEKYPHRIVNAYNNLGNYYFEQFKNTPSDNSLDKASDNYNEAINLKTEDPQVYCNMGSLMGAKGKYDMSLKYYSLALKLDSNDAITYVDRAITYSAMGKYDLAVKDYRRSAGLNPNSEILIRNIAFTYLNAHQFDSAIYYYTRVIKINPNNSGYFHYRGVAEFDEGNIKPAMNDFMQDLQINPHDSECMFYVSIAYNRAGDFNNAYKYAQMAQRGQYAVPDDYIRLLRARLDIKNEK
jgi:tetratricopeptide (TPR) repeat protein